MSSSRNKRRIIQKSYENLVLEVDALDEISVGTVELSDNSVLDNLLPDNTTVYNDGAQYSYGLEKEAINSSSEYDSDEVNDADQDFKSGLVKWVAKHKINGVAVDDLLKLLSANIPGGNLPESYKTLMKTPTKYKIDLIDGGQYYHFGLERQLQRLSKIAGFTDNFETIELKIGIDGLPISRSSKKQFWPILASGDILNNGKPFLVGLYFSLFCKPEKSDQLLGPLVEELTLLLANGVEINGLVRKISIKCIVADAPARNFVKNCVAFNGYYGCDRCTQKGQWLGRVVFSELDAPLRNDQDFRRNMYHNHQVKESILSKLEIGMVSSFVLDYMHLVCLGVTRKLISCWRSGPIPLRIGRQNIAQISERLIACKNFIPSEFNRKPRSLVEVDYWKATEYRTFLLYLGQGKIEPHPASDTPTAVTIRETPEAKCDTRLVSFCSAFWAAFTTTIVMRLCKQSWSSWTSLTVGVSVAVVGLVFLAILIF
ncbi:hypothetical protein Fcan01_24156 [Folsomia candida]|uniref:Transposase domain-containing protein n=1 Tax=Folsomia candida TaxID=158441 RepID=A0A226D8S2_FOLCA|nr:hypothetical protein Fcan01_24156 [Folsomia candida]